MENEKKKKILLIVLAVLAVILIGVGVYFTFFNKPVNKDNNEVDTYKPSEVLPYDESGINLQEEIKALNLKYADAKCWIRIPGTIVDYPVFQGSTNDRYLRNDRDNKANEWGELFLDYRCNLDNMSDKSHFIVYGHNTTKDDRFFGSLLKYQDKKYFDENKIIEMSTINGNYKWEIFSVYKTTPDFFYIDVSFADMTEYSQFLNTLKSKSLYDTNVNIDSSDTILTLSTCEYTQTDGRFVVQARLIK